MKDIECMISHDTRSKKHCAKVKQPITKVGGSQDVKMEGVHLDTEVHKYPQAAV